MKNTPPFFVGQEVVAIRNVPIGGIKKGDEYIVRAITYCCTWKIDIGLVHPSNCNCKCGICLKDLQSSLWWASAKIFAPKDQFEAITFTKVMEQELTSVN